MVSLQEKQKALSRHDVVAALVMFRKERLFLFSITGDTEISLFFIHRTLYLCTNYIFFQAIYKASAKNGEDKKEQREETMS